MEIAIATFLLALPLLLFIVGVLTQRSFITLLGAMGLFFVGLYLWANPVETYYLSGENRTTTTNSVTNETVETVSYTYSSRTLPDGVNMAFMLVPTLLGLSGMLSVALRMKESSELGM